MIKSVYPYMGGSGFMFSSIELKRRTLLYLINLVFIIYIRLLLGHLKTKGPRNQLGGLGDQI